MSQKIKKMKLIMLTMPLVGLLILLWAQGVLLRELTANYSGMSFAHVVIDPSPPSGAGCCLDVLGLGDVDGDGKTDIVVGAEHAAGLVWYHYPSWTRYMIGSGDFTTDGEVVDIDGDGDGDVVVSSISRNRIEWWENTGNPFEQAGWVRHDIGAAFAHDLAVGDLNGDGRIDVVILKKGDARELTWFDAPPDPRGTWRRHPIDVPQGEGLDIGDIDGDGDLDIVVSHYWYENVNGDGRTWTRHTITSSWGVDCRAIIADMNGDGRADVVLSHSEGAGRLSWFENPTWTEHAIEPGILHGAHSLEVGDFDRDGDLDVFTGEMHFTSTKRVLVYENLGDGKAWKKVVLATTGTHNARIGDIGGDGRLDIVGKNFDGPKMVEMWKNTTPLDHWSYTQVDNKRRIRAFGLAMGDLTGDGYADIVSGPYFYRNPGGDMTGKWARINLPKAVDAMLIVDVDGDAYADVIGENLPDVYWLEATDTQGHAWKAIRVGTLPTTSHGNSQGYALAQIVPGGPPEIVFSSGKSEIYYFEIPANPTAGNWPRTLITSEATDEGIGVGDIDGDGDIDIAAGDMYTGGDRIAWWGNPGNGTGHWTKHQIGTVDHWPDRFAVVDINRDGRPDIVVSEENIGDIPNACVYWFEQPATPANPHWPRHTVSCQYTVNSMDVADMDGDGDYDIITGEHRGTGKVVVWLNGDNGSTWGAHVVSMGRESHLGSRVADLDGDGDLDIVSIAWDHYQYLHLWRNDARHRGTAADPTSPTASRRFRGR